MQVAGRETLGLMPAFENLKPTRSDTSTLAKPCHPILPNSMSIGNQEFKYVSLVGPVSSKAPQGQWRQKLQELLCKLLVDLTKRQCLPNPTGTTLG